MRSSRQRSTKIGWLRARPASSVQARARGNSACAPRLGYVEGKNIAFEYRSAEGKLDRFPALADELVRLKVDVLLTSSTTEALRPRTLPGRSPSFFDIAVILLRVGWSIAWRGPGGTSRGSPPFRRCWLANDWSYSRKPFPSSPVLRCCGIHRDPGSAQAMERKPTGGTRTGSAASFHGSEQRRQIRERFQRSD